MTATAYAAARRFRSVRRLLPMPIVLFTLGVTALSAHASAAAPAWKVTSVASPTNFTVGSVASCMSESLCEGYFVTATNVGTVTSTGTIEIKDVVPDDTVVVAVPQNGARAYELNNQNGEGENISCSRSATVVTCAYGGPIQPAGVITLHVEVEVTGGSTTVQPNHVEVHEEGSQAPASKSNAPSTSLGGAPAEFGVQQFSVETFGPAGEADEQAGAHPATVATTITYNTVLDVQGDVNEVPYEQVNEPKVENVDLPMGFVGDALSAPRCTAVAAAAETCPADTRVGVVGLYKSKGTNDAFLYLYNLIPEAGYPAQFGFAFLHTVIMLRPRVLPSESGYVLSVPVPAVPRAENVKLREVSVTFFGNPALMDSGTAGEAFATNPMSCQGGALNAKLEMNAWERPGDWQFGETAMFAGSGGEGVTGCGELQFNPTVGVTPETTQTDSPSGYEVDLRVPQAPNVEGDLATSDLKNAVVSFPAGVSVDPSAANGLAACQASGPEGIELGDHDKVDADRLAEEGVFQEGEEWGYHGNEDGLVHAAAGHCPQASQIGEVEVVTPLVAEPLKGHLYVAQPGCGGAGQNACTDASAEDGELFGVYLEVAGSGVVVKLHGEVSVNPQTGQLTTEFDEAPELPFSELKLKLNGGQRAPLANPQSCGVFTLTSDLTPWSAPFTGDATPLASYPVSGCTGAFDPGFSAGMSATLHAGAFSPFTLTLSRHDGEGDLSGLTVNMPVGLLGRIAGIQQCPASAASLGSCGVVAPGSRVGSVLAAAGAGGAPFWQRGSVYLTGPYDGGPFGLSVVVPAVAGPYNLGDIVVRAGIRINPVTSAVSVVSDPLPQMVDGVPLRVQTINVTVGEGGNFTFNPTDCAKKEVSASVSDPGGAVVGVSAPFGASGCAALPFKPSVAVSTAGKASKAKGASLDTKIAMPAAVTGSGMAGADANIASVKVELPKQLPARNTTLQKACLAAVFQANPASCPAASDVGSVLVHTPVLASPLVGPAYLVSYGGAKFPDMVMILQAEGVKIEVTGSIYVSKKGITSVTVKSVPDAPITSFELKTPTGPYSVLTSYVPAKDEFNLCGQSLVMPTEITAQNGLVFKQSTKIAITGCSTAKKKAKGARNARNARRARNAKHARRSAGGRG
jgi:hypothetical protein